MSDFVGRRGYMATLEAELDRVRQTGRGRLVSMRGRRRVGKSRLVDEFLRRDAHPPVPYAFFTASRQPLARELEMFAQDVARSDLPAAAAVRGGGVVFESWDGALTFLATAAGGTPQVIVIDEFPYLVEQDPSVEATLQKVWDRYLREAPILLLLIGSDISMMSALTEYDRPLYGRPTLEMVVEPFGPQETTEMLGLPAAEAIDAQLVLGGFPQITQEWRPGMGMWDFLEEQLSNSTSPLIVGGERILSAEFPEEARARQVLATIGSGERTFTTIQRRAGIHETTLQRALAVLVGQKRMVSAERPLSSRTSRETHYAVADPYLRFWLRFVGPNMAEIERDRGDLVVARIREGWSAYRGRAVEPLVRESIFRMLPDERFGEAQYVGGYWTRKGDVEVDLVGAEKKACPRRVAFVGSIKWRERTPFGGRDLGRIAAQRDEVPGTDEDTVLIGVSREGFDEQGKSLDAALVPEDLLEAWKR
jgi:AAA+ ATPase superfamily predicted ATPase